MVASQGAKASTEQLKNKLQEKGQGEKPQRTLLDLVGDYTEKFAGVLANRITPDKFMRNITWCIQTTPGLLTCNPTSVLTSIMQAAQLGLEPGPLAHCYLIPRYSKTTEQNEATFMISYKGMIELARRNGIKLVARIVYENDTLEVEYGFEDKVTHKPFMDGDRGNIRGAYAIAKLPDESFHVEWMSYDDLMKIKETTKYYDKKAQTHKFSAIWEKNEEEMCRKSVVRRTFKYLPIRVEDMRLVEQEGSIKHDIQDDMSFSPHVDRYAEEDARGSEQTAPVSQGNVVEAEFEEIPPQTSESPKTAPGPSKGQTAPPPGDEDF